MKGIQKSAYEKALAKMGLTVGRALLQRVSEAGKLDDNTSLGKNMGDWMTMHPKEGMSRHPEEGSMLSPKLNTGKFAIFYSILWLNTHHLELTSLIQYPSPHYLILFCFHC